MRFKFSKPKKAFEFDCHQKIDVGVCSKKYIAFDNKTPQILLLDQARFLPNSSFLGFQNVEFEHVSSSKIYCFFEFELEFVSSISSIGSSNTSILHFFEFEFIENPYH